LSVMKAFVARAAEVSSGEAIDLLVIATSLIGGVPFDAVGYDWSYEYQFNAEACEAIESTCVRLAELALDVDDVEIARKSASLGLRALPLNERLYRCRMRAEAHGGNRAGVRSAYEELCSRLADLDDEASPSSGTRELFETLWCEPSERRSA